MKKHINLIKKASDGAPSIANSLMTLCSARQVLAIRNLSAKLKIDENEISKVLFDCGYEELSKSGAEDVIREMETRQEKQAA